MEQLHDRSKYTIAFYLKKRKKIGWPGNYEQIGESQFKDSKKLSSKMDNISLIDLCALCKINILFRT